MSVIFRLLPKISVAVAAVISMFFQVNIAFSAPQLSPLEITADHEVIYCTTGPVPITDKVKQALNEGTPVIFSWEIIIDEVNDYWIDDAIGSITVVRQAVPDLISKSWLLTDTSSGISQRVYSVEEVIQFLSRLQNFPTLDRSLLTSGTLYSFRIKLHIHEGELSDSWWSEATRFGKTVALEEVALP
ncbi:MAG: DUF4390 domain-containing protein [Mariprofundaceae bacterium]